MEIMCRTITLQELYAILPKAVLEEVAIKAYGKRTGRIVLGPTLSLADRALLPLLKVLKQAVNDDANRMIVRLLERAAAAHVLHTQATYVESELPMPRPGRLSARQIRRIDEYTESNLAHRLAVDDLARHVGMSRAAFARRFKETTDMTPHQFIVQMRVRRATRLLADSNLTVAEVAAHTGFSNSSHFSTIFRQTVKISPSEYRAQTSAPSDVEN